MAQNLRRKVHIPLKFGECRGVKFSFEEHVSPLARLANWILELTSTPDVDLGDFACPGLYPALDRLYHTVNSVIWHVRRHDKHDFVVTHRLNCLLPLGLPLNATGRPIGGGKAFALYFEIHERKIIEFGLQCTPNRAAWQAPLYTPVMAIMLLNLKLEFLN